MIDDAVDIIGTAIIFVAPVVLVLVAIIVVVAYPWLLVIPVGLWWLTKKYGTEPTTAPSTGSFGRFANAPKPNPASAPPRDAVPQHGSPTHRAEAGTSDGAERRREPGHDIVCLTWNLGRRSHPDHADLIRFVGPDIVALQEVSNPGHTALANALTAIGLRYKHGGPTPLQAFPFTSMIASRWPIRDANPEGLDVPFPERVQIAIVNTPFGDIEVLNVHVPAATSSGVAVKVSTFEGIARYLARPSPIPRLMCGDFNTPKSELDGRPQYWGTAHQQQAERAVIEGHAATGLRDAFRAVHGPHTTAASWRASKSTARRYDHVFASPELTPVEATYGDLDEMLARGISDHAPLRVVFRVTREAIPRKALTLENARPSLIPEPEPTPAPIATSATAREETATPTTDDTELRAFLQTLTYHNDAREPPDDRRRIQFRIGWTKASQGPAISDKTLADRLTWANLGYRAGKAFGQATATTIDGVFDRFAAIYAREKA